MGKYRDREREAIPDDDWEEGQDAQVIVHPKWKIRRGPSVPAAKPEESDWTDAAKNLSKIEPFDPAKYHEPPELYSQDSLDALRESGFYQENEPGVWHRPVTTDAGEDLGARHTIVYEPGHRRPSDNSRAPWHLLTDPETAGEAFRTPGGAISAADADQERIRRLPKHARLYLVSSWTEDQHGE